jgi:hypothetical protein
MLKISAQNAIVVLALLAGCTGTKISKDIPMRSGHYFMKTSDQGSHMVFVNVVDDSVAVYPIADHQQPTESTFLSHNSLLIDRSFDFDVLSVPFKFRPSASGFPRQITADFNGNIFLGYRSDRFRTRYLSTPAGRLREIKERAFTVGVFGGIGTTFVSPWTTNYKTTDEYNGFILSRGLSFMTGLNKLTIGVGIGWDSLTDRDRDIWIYQHKLWYGGTISLNLN